MFVCIQAGRTECVFMHTDGALLGSDASYLGAFDHCPSRT